MAQHRFEIPGVTTGVGIHPKKMFLEDRQHLIDLLIPGPGREDHRHQQVEGFLRRQFAGGRRPVVLEDTINEGGIEGRHGEGLGSGVRGPGSKDRISG